MGTPNQSEKEHFAEIKKYQSQKDWTFDRDDTEIIEHCKCWIKASKKFEKECEDLNIWFVDTSKNRMKILNDTLNKIVNLCKTSSKR